MEYISPTPSRNNPKIALEILCENKNNILAQNELTEIVRLLIFKLNESATEIHKLKNDIERQQAEIKFIKSNYSR